ncbi:MAG: hypothetical protein H6662_01640 [Ardenticatenaceae bacterium]|nr:hypothetical protein [Anaerolineales bacterium]MCB8920260.1 hypothetical protein [Ardenticatenaceae bacterium]MCB9004932.1 hypothetical protein [Ardenticatenaceae bacterium]
MGDYIRSTRECTPDSMNPLLSAAIRTHLEKYELGDAIASPLMCCETTSTKKKKGLFGSKVEVTLLGVILTSKWLFWAVGKESETPGVLSARLRELRVQDYEKSEMYKLVQDTGMNVSGLRTGAGDAGTAFIGLGPEVAAQKFRALLKETIANL